MSQQHLTPTTQVRRWLLFCLTAALTVLFASHAGAAAPASDDAAQSAYNDGWQTGDNGGTGFGTWTLTGGTNAGHFIGNCDIAVSSKCWGMFANTSQLSESVRSFSTALTTGEVFTLFMDNGDIQTGGTVGFGLRNSSGNNLLEFYFTGGGSTYTVDDATGARNSGVSFTTSGLKLEITLTSASTFYMTITKLSDNSVTRFAGPLKNPTGGQTVSQLRLFNFNAGTGSSRDAFFNSASVVAGPTPAALVINEIDYDQIGTDDGEFLEIKNTGVSAVNLDPYHIALLQGNGTDPLIKSSIDLPNVSLAAGDYYVICGNAANVPNCDLDVTPNTNLLENDKDGAALVLGGTRVDSVSYEGDVAAPFTEGSGIINKDDRNDRGYDSLSRIPDGTDTNHNNNDFQRVCATPGLANVNSTDCGAYVATTGTDTNNNCGIAAQPCATVARGITRAGNVETINVAGGSYAESPTLDGGTMSHWAGGGGGDNWTLNDLTIDGGTVNAPPGTLTFNGTSTSDNVNFTNNSSFNAGSGTQTVAFAGRDTGATNGNGRVWGSSATTFNHVTISYNGSGSNNDDVFGVDFFDQSTTQRATINGTLTLNTRTFVAHAENGSSGTGASGRSDGTPLYGTSSTLRYNVGYPENEGGARPVLDAFQVFGEWIPGNTSSSQPGVPNDVHVTGDSWVSFLQNQGSYVILGDLTIDRGVDGNNYGGDGVTTAKPPGFEQSGFNIGTIGSSTLRVDGAVDNSGTLKQNGTVSSGTVNFLRITNVAGTETRYFGLDVAANGNNLGDVIVKISGNGDIVGGSGHEELCPYVFVNPIDPPVGRCYYIDPDNASGDTVGINAAVAVTFYYEHAELPDYGIGFTVADLRVWKDNGDGTWTVIDQTGSTGCTPGQIDCSVTVNMSSTLLASGANRYVISPYDPSTTPVTLSYFSAELIDGSVQATWQTSTELGHLGFNLYAVTPTGRQLLTERPIFTQATSPTTPQDYVWRATGADVIPATAYYLEEIDIYGKTRLHGPFALGEPFGARVAPPATDWAAIRAESAAKATARAAADGARLQAGFGVNAQTGIDVLVAQTGLYRVTHADLLAFGLDISGLRLNRLSLTQAGQPVPIYVGGGGTQWHAGSFIEFYGEGLDTLYTDTNVYFLSANSADSRRIARDTNPVPGTPPPAFYTATETVEHDNRYGMLAPTDDPWYDTMLLAWGGSAEYTAPFDAPDYVADATAVTLSVDIWGLTSWPDIDPDHHLTAYVNDTWVGDIAFDGQLAQTLTVALPSGLLQAAGNTLRLVAPGDTGAPWDMIAVDRFSITYPRAFVAQDNRLTFQGQADAFRVTGLTGGIGAVYRLTDDGPVRLMRATIVPDGDAFAVTFRGAATDAGYIIASAEGVLTPVLRAARPYSDITGGSADYVLITHPDFSADLDPLVQFHTANGLTVRIVDVDDIYAQFGHGIFDAQAIRDYITHAVTQMGARFVLLVGGDSYDYRDFTGNASLSFVPSLYASTTVYSRYDPVDPLYADVDGDNVPDAAIGRFPARSSAELTTLIDRTLLYAAKPYGGTALFAADNAEGGVSFSAIADMLVGQLNGAWSVSRAYLDVDSVATARSTTIDAINDGVALTSFVGHSGPYSWTYDGLFGSADAAALTNAGAPTLVVQWGCWNTYYVDPAADTLAHAFLLSGDRGAAAVMGATSLTWAGSEEALGRQLMPHLTQSGLTVGEAMLNAKTELAQLSPGALDALLGWTLLGDPALVVQP